MSDLPVISTQLPDLVNAYVQARDARLAADKVAAGLKEAEDSLSKTIIARYREEGILVMGAGQGTVKMTEHVEPTCADWAVLYEFIKKNDAFELLHKRITATAVKERWAEGDTVPGVVSRTEYKLSVSKA